MTAVQAMLWYNKESVIRVVAVMRFADYIDQEKARCVDPAVLCELYNRVFLALHPDKEGLLSAALEMFCAENFQRMGPTAGSPMCSSQLNMVSEYAPWGQQQPSLNCDVDPCCEDSFFLDVADPGECAQLHGAVIEESVWVCGPWEGGRTGFVGVVVKYQGLCRYETVGAVVWHAKGADEIVFDDKFILRYFHRNPSMFEEERYEVVARADYYWAQVPGSLQFQAVPFAAFFEWFSQAFLQGANWGLVHSLLTILPRFLTRDGSFVTLETWRKFFACFWRGEAQRFCSNEWLLISGEFGGFITASETEKAFSSGTERQCLVRYSESLGDYGCLVFSWSMTKGKLPKFVNASTFFFMHTHTHPLLFYVFVFHLLYSVPHEDKVLCAGCWKRRCHGRDRGQVA